MSRLRYPVAISSSAPFAVFEARGPEAELAAAVAEAGLDWPAQPHQAALDPNGTELVRLGPNRLLAIGRRDLQDEIGARLAAAFARQPTAEALDVSDMLAGFTVTGPGAEDVLRQGAPLDLDADVFPPGRTTGTELWGVTVILGRRTAPQEGFLILVDSAYAAFIEEWLAVASGAGPVRRPGTMVNPPARIRPKS
jgi:heterotetrameric sarcosine oxidase gamma subunit